MTSPTLKTIARATGFSVTTVSRALGGFDDVNAETRALILAEADRQGYQPNLNARLLKHQRTQTLGLIAPVTAPRRPDRFFNEFVTGVSHRATAAGFDVLLSTSESTDDIAPYRRLVSRGRVDGVILARTARHDARIDYLLAAGVPFAVFGRSANAREYTHIDVDGIHGQRAVTEHLIRLGHRRIAYVTPPPHLMFSEYRLAGFKQAMDDHRLPVDPALIVAGDLTEAGGEAAAAALLALADPPTAIMCGNDLTAFGVINACETRGLTVGRDVSVTGFDDVPFASYLKTPLTTVGQPIYDIAQQLTTLLLQMVAGDLDPASPRGMLIEPELIVRASTGAPVRRPG